MSFDQWTRLNEKIINQHLSWDQIRSDLLEILRNVDSRWAKGAIPEGQYRQKGNYFKRTLVALVRAQCGVELVETRVRGKTDIHAVDISYIQEAPSQQKKANRVLLVAEEVKMIGSPKHRAGKEIYPERTIGIDIDKRLKEAKYTPIDLKRLVDPNVTAGWQKLIDLTHPAFFTAWLMRLGSTDRVDHVSSKLEGATEYSNGVGVAI